MGAAADSHAARTQARHLLDLSARRQSNVPIARPTAMALMNVDADTVEVSVDAAGHAAMMPASCQKDPSAPLVPWRCKSWLPSYFLCAFACIVQYSFGQAAGAKASFLLMLHFF